MHDLKQRLRALREQIEAKTAEKETVDAAPIPEEEATARIDAMMDAVENDPVLGPAPPGLTSGTFAFHDLRDLLQRPGFLLALFRDEIKADLLGRYRAEMGDDKPGLAFAERRKRLAALDAEILKLGVEEEHLVEQLEAAGESVERRGDADPRAVLGLGEAAAG